MVAGLHGRRRAPRLAPRAGRRCRDGRDPLSSERRALAVLGAVLAFLALIPVVAVALQLGAWAVDHAGWLGWVEAVTGPVCHRDPARTLAPGGRPLPVCARCTGMYLAAAAGGLVGLALGANKGAMRASLGVGLVALVVGFGFALAEHLDRVHTGNAVRLVLGAMLGVAPTLVAGLGARVILDQAVSPRARTPTDAG